MLQPAQKIPVKKVSTIHALKFETNKNCHSALYLRSRLEKGRHLLTVCRLCLAKSSFPDFPDFRGKVFGRNDFYLVAEAEDAVLDEFGCYLDMNFYSQSFSFAVINYLL